MTKKKKIGIMIGVGVLIVLIIISAIFLCTRKKETNSLETMEPVEMMSPNIPNITEENLECNISTTEPTSENVTVSITDKTEEYPIYYAVAEIIKQEEEDTILQAEIPNEDYCLYEKEIRIEKNSVIFLKYKSEETYSTIPYEIKITNILAPEEQEGEQQENVSKEELEKANVEKKEKKNNTSPYYIKVNYGANVVTIYKKDEQDEYTIPVKAMVCSCGTATPTSGVYKISNKYTWRKLVGGVYGQYATRIVGSILFHSVPYTAPSNDALEYWEYDKLGTKASAGCVRLTVTDASWIYHNCPSGTMVEFFSSSDVGPLGKPSSRKITQYEQWRNWDPTDPVSGNPWKSANEKEENEKKPENPTNTVVEPTNPAVDNNTTKEETPKEPEKEENNTSSSNEVNQNTNNTIQGGNNTVEEPSKDNTISKNEVNNTTMDLDKNVPKEEIK